MRAKVILVALALAVLSCDRLPMSGEPDVYPAIFTPDGTGLVLAVKRGQVCFLYRADIATGVTRRVTSATSGCESTPAFSPDGLRLVFLRIERIGEHASVMSANADGTDARMLVNNQSDNLSPHFVPHTNEIVYLRSGAFEAYSPVARPHQTKFDVYAVDITTRETTRLTHKEYYQISELSVSPDGRQLLLSLYDTSGANFIVTSIDSAEKPIMRLQPRPFAYVTHAVWMPDGRSVLFAGGTLPPNGGNYDYNIYRLTIGTGDVVPLTQFSGTFTGFAVSADGTKIVALYRNAYYVVDVTTHQMTQVPLKL